MEKFIQKTEMSKEELIEKYRYIMVEDSDYLEFIIQDKKEELEKIGFNDIDVKYSGFYCQGDGASITCKINLIDAIKILNIDLQYKKYTDEVVFTISRINSRYCHENTLQIDNDLYLDNRLTIKAERWINDYIKDIECFLFEYVQNESRKIYSQLENEYNFLTSDDIVFDYIIENKEIFGIEEIN